MKVYFRNISIKNKIIGLILTASILTVTLGSGINLFMDVKFKKRNVIDHALFQAEIVAEYCVPSLDFNLPERAEDILNTFTTREHVLQAAIFDVKLDLFAKSGDTSKILLSGNSSQSVYVLKDDILLIWRPIVYNNDFFGVIYTKTNTGLSAHIRNQILTTLFLVAGLCFLAYLLAGWLQGYVSGPVTTLTGFTNRVISSSDYSMRIDRKSEDEIGLLFDRVNALLQKIETHESQRDLATESLRASEEKFRSLVETLNDFIWETDEQFNYTFVSPGITKILGYQPDEIIRKTPYDILSPEDIDNAKATFFRLLSEGRTVNGVRMNRMRKDRSSIILESSGMPIFNQTGHIIGYRGVDRDITESLKAAELLQKKEAAEMANRSKSVFLANISHEIRNPMNVIIGMANMIMDDDANSTSQKQHINSLKIASGNLLNIINEILDFSKIESGKVELISESFNLHQLMKETSDLFREQAELKNIALTVELAKKTPRFVKGDAGKIKQILTNLLGNAVKFTDSGSITVSVDVTRNEDTNIPTIQFAVADTGIGIHEDDLTKIFDPFTQVDSSSTKAYAGTGLGLAIVSKLLLVLNGTITARSEPGQGTTITFDLPLIRDKQTRSDKDAVSATQAIESPSKRIKLLVAEDEMLNLLYLKSLLEKRNWEILTAKNGAEAIEQFKTGRPDLILMDGQMPVMDGFEAIRRIRELKELSGDTVPIIAVTGYAVTGDENMFKQAGANQYISKPFNEQHLISLIVRLTK